MNALLRLRYLLVVGSLVVGALLLIGNSANASLVTSLNFVTDFSNSEVNNPNSGSTGTNQSTVSANTIVAKKGNGGGTFGLRLAYIGAPIDTTGFKDLQLSFSYVEVGTLEHNITDGSSVSGDGLILGGDLIFNSNLNSGAPSPPLSYSSSFDNGSVAISSLEILLAVNANTEEIEISDMKILGTPIVSVPEAGSLVVWTVLATVGLAFLRGWR
ncbi:hypothetical protein [Aeoliella sp.]|uniref:hypothetical protein n=1 Tax=Aeoliella sp. TaxID=2795800 RepID=UPI003CCC1BED